MRTTKGSDHGGKTAADGTGAAGKPEAGGRTDAGARGVPVRAGLGAAAGQRLPVPPRERKPALAALAVLLILGGALVSAYLVIASGNRVSAIRIREPVAAGQRIPPSAMEEVQISANTGLEYVPWERREQFGQAYAVVNLVSGTLLTGGMASEPGANPAAEGKVVVGLALKPGQVPVTDLSAGAQVSVYAVGAQGAQGGVPAGGLLAEQAVVYDISRPGEDDLQSDVIQMSIAVPAEQAPGVAQAAAAGAVAVALIPPGVRPPPAGDAPPAAPPASGPASPGAGQGGGDQNGVPPAPNEPGRPSGQGGGGQNGRTGGNG